MKTNPLVSLLLAVLFVNAVATAFLSYQYVRTVGKQQRLWYVRAQINQNWSAFQSLLGETIEYSKRNPAIDPMLQALGVKTNTVPNTTGPRATQPTPSK